MNRRLGISILGVLFLTIGVLLAEYAFAPLRDPYPAVDKPSPPPNAESTASPREAAPAAPAHQSQHVPLPVERRNAAGEAEGNPMVAEARPVIDAVWQNVADSVTGGVRVSVVPTVALVGREPAGSTATVSGGAIGLGGAFLGTQRASVSSPKGATPPHTAASPMAANAPGDTIASDAGPAVTDDPPNNPGVAPDAMLAMNDEPSSPVIDGVSDPGAPLSSMPQTTEPLVLSEESAPSSPPSTSVDSQKEGMAQTEPMDDMLDHSAPLPPLPEVSVPEPLSGSLFLFGMLLVVVSRRHRRPA